MLLSEHDVTSEDGEVIARPRSVHVHPKYGTRSLFDYDFALVELPV